MPEELLHRREVRAEHEEDAGVRVTNVVKAHVAPLRDGPELHAAARAGPKRGVRVLLVVAAALPPTLVPEARDVARPPERAAQDVLRLPGLRPHLTAVVWKEVRPLEALERVLEERHQLLGDPDRPVLLVLRVAPAVARACRDEPPLEVHVVLEEPAELTLAEAGEDRGREDRALVELERGEEREHLVGPEDLGLVVRDRARADLLGGVLAEPLARLLRPVEGADEVLAEVVDGPRRELGFFALQEELDVAGEHVLEELRRERGAREVLANRVAVARVRFAPLRVGVEPPLEQVRDRPFLRVERDRSEPEPLALDLDLLLVELELDGLLRPVAGGDRNPHASRVLELEPVAALVREDRAHLVLLPPRPDQG
ncbi:MAG: hypothetical protein U0229_13195 [Anaeromyxobacter sp.]